MTSNDFELKKPQPHRAPQGTTGHHRAPDSNWRLCLALMGHSHIRCIDRGEEELGTCAKCCASRWCRGAAPKEKAQCGSGWKCLEVVGSGVGLVSHKPEDRLGSIPTSISLIYSAPQCEKQVDVTKHKIPRKRSKKQKKQNLFGMSEFVLLGSMDMNGYELSDFLAFHCHFELVSIASQEFNEERNMDRKSFR